MKISRQKRIRIRTSSLLQFSQRQKGTFSQSNYLRMIKDALKETPEIREDKVNMIKKAIWAGNYWVESEKIAEKMLKESIRDLLL